MKSAILLAMALSAAACSNGTTGPDDDDGAQHPVDVGQTVQLRIGETAAIRGTAVTIRFTSVEADSRCPINAICVWQGDAHIRLDLSNERGPAERGDVHTGLDPKAVQFAGYTIRLVEVAPSRVATTPVPAREYAVKLEITR